jgi:hypothetical protein
MVSENLSYCPVNTKNQRLTQRCRYPTHAFIVLTLQKLVHLYASDNEDSDADDDDQSQKSGRSKRSTRSTRRLLRRLKRAFRSRERDEQQKKLGDPRAYVPGELGGYLGPQPGGFPSAVNSNQLRTLQRYHTSPNDERTRYMEKHSSLASRHLAVACEQVSMFITNDNTIISFFEQSAQDIEAPIIRRLQTSDTIIRQ